MGSSVLLWTLKLTARVGEAELSAASFLKNIVRRDVALQGQEMTAAPGREQTHAAVQDRLHRVSLRGYPNTWKKKHRSSVNFYSAAGSS